jgi:outer membrane murein-binding lipoprotein Lpp
MTKQSFIWALALISSLNLSGCTDAKQDQSTALCIEAMDLNASQLRWNNERKQEIINHSCVQGASGRTAEQWQCVVTAMKKNESYVKATDTCFPK